MTVEMTEDHKICARNAADFAEKLGRIESLFAELEIPPPYDLWLAESIQIRERLKKQIKELTVFIEKTYPESVPRESSYIIKELQKILGEKNV